MDVYRKVKSLMVLHDIKGVEIARKLNRSPKTVSIVLTGRGRSKYIEQAVADALGMPHEKLFPPHKKAA
jgi:transcriptional regulator with XRE-family HTH domain